MTEDEAKTKVCCGPPHVAWINLAIAAQGNVKDPKKIDLCMASACMAWRLAPARASVKTSGTEPFDTDNPVEYEEAGGWIVTRYPPDGYCGLAGAPQ